MGRTRGGPLRGGQRRQVSQDSAVVAVAPCSSVARDRLRDRRVSCLRRHLLLAASNRYGTDDDGRSDRVSIVLSLLMWPFIVLALVWAFGRHAKLQRESGTAAASVAPSQMPPGRRYLSPLSGQAARLRTATSMASTHTTELLEMEVGRT